MNLKKILTGAVLALVVGGVGMWVLPAGAQTAPAAAPKLAGIRTINLLKAFQDMLQRTDSDNEINALGEELKKSAAELKEEFDALQAGLKNFKGDALKDQEARVLKKASEMAVQQDFFERRMAMESRLKTLDIYAHLKAGIESYAKENGIVLVLSAEDVNMNEARTAQELQMKISLRKVMYADPSLDITKQVVEKLNVDWQKEKDAKKRTGG